MSINQVQNKQGQQQPSQVQASGKCHKRRAGQSDQPSAFAQKLKAKQDPSAKSPEAPTNISADSPRPEALSKDGPLAKQDMMTPRTTSHASHEHMHQVSRQDDMQTLVPHELTHKQGLGQISDREQRHEQTDAALHDRLDSSHVEVEQRTTHQQVQRAKQAQSVDRQVLQTLVEQIVKSCHVGQNARKQRVLLMHVEIPGQGKVHIKLEQQRQGTRLRFRVADASLAQKIKSNAPTLHERLRERGIDVTRVEVSTRASPQER